MKMFHIMGARVILLPQFDAAEVLRLLPVERVSVVLGVPTMLNELLNHESFPATDVSSVRLLYYGAYDPSGIMSRTAEVFGAREGRIEMAHTYGLTEGGPFVTLCPPADLFAHWGSIGRPMPGVEVALLDESGADVPAGQAGEICFRGPRMSGYWRKPEATEAALEGGWLHTGDVAIADEEGFLTIVDRKKDMIRTGGQNVYSKQIEDCLLLHEAVQDVAIIGLPDPAYEERVCAVVVLKQPERSSELLKQQLQDYVRGELAGYNTPRDVIFVEELPKNAVGKTQKHLLREQFGSMFDSPRGGAPAAAR
jgi:acyl-CoA synthetase (AMP-forming)/AMP-acid ligase II